MIHIDLAEYLLGETTITNYVSNRIYADQLPVNTYPCITFHIISRTHGQKLVGSDDTNETRIQIDIWSNDLEEVETIRINLQALLQSFKGVMGDTNIGNIIYDNDFIDVEEEEGTINKLYHSANDYLFLCDE